MLCSVARTENTKFRRGKMERTLVHVVKYIYVYEIIIIYSFDE